MTFSRTPKTTIAERRYHTQDCTRQRQTKTNCTDLFVEKKNKNLDQNSVSVGIY